MKFKLYLGLKLSTTPGRHTGESSTIFNLATRWRVVSFSTPRLNSNWNALVHTVWGWMDHTDHMDAMKRRNISYPCRKLNPHSSVIHTVEWYQLNYPGSKNQAINWVVTKCSSERYRCFGGTFTVYELVTFFGWVLVWPLDSEDGSDTFIRNLWHFNPEDHIFHCHSRENVSSNKFIK
jgi:hypothetical protein